MTSLRRNPRRGSALFAALIVVILIGGLTGAYVSRVLSRSQAQTDLAMQEGVLRGLEGAIGIKLAQLETNAADVTPVFGVMTGTSGSVATSTRYAVVAAPVLNDPTLLFIAAAAGEGNVLKRSVLIVKKPITAVNAGQPAALMAYGGTLNLSNNVIINGNDHSLTGTSITGGTNQLALQVTNGSATDGSNTTLGGGGVMGTGTSAVTNASIVQTLTTSTSTYPVTPDQAVGVPEGTLKAAAQQGGTYFSDPLVFTTWLNNYLASHGNQMPGGAIIYMDFYIASTSNILAYSGMVMNSTPSLLINHYSPTPPQPGIPNGTSDLGNAHIAFKGLIIFDNAKHFNASSQILGGMISLANGAATGNVFANGGFTLNYSTSVLSGLPSVQIQGQPCQVVLWSEEGPFMNAPLVGYVANYAAGALLTVAPYTGLGIQLP